MSDFDDCRNLLKRVPKQQTAPYGRCQSSKSIKDLNIDCLLHICSFLSVSDRFKLMLVCENLEDITNELDFGPLMSKFNFKESKRILSRIGPNIEKITYKLFTSSFSFRVIDVIFQIKKNCQNIREINFSIKCYSHDLKIRPNNFELVKSLILSSKQIQVLKLKGCDLTDENCKTISTLTQLKSLNLSLNRRITGRYLNKLKNLSNLYLRECFRFEAKHFIAICKANKLKTLDIRTCRLLGRCTIMAVAETQTCLETLRVSYISGVQFQLLSKQKNLNIFQMLGTSEDCLSVLTKAVRLEIELLERFSLTLYLDDNEKLLEKYRLQILRLKNIKTLHLNGLTNPADDMFLVRLAQNCTQLEELLISEAENITQRGVIYVVENLQNLKVLDLEMCPFVDEILFHKIVAVRKARKSVPIKIHVQETFIEENFLQNDAYKKTKNLVTLSFESVNFKKNYKKWIGLCGTDFCVCNH